MASVYKRGGKKNRDGVYYAAWNEVLGGRVVRRTMSTGTTEKAAALRIANKKETDAALRREGVIDPALDAISKESRRTIESHLDDFEAKMRAAGRTDKHIRSTLSFTRAIASHAGFSVVNDMFRS